MPKGSSSDFSEASKCEILLAMATLKGADEVIYLPTEEVIEATVGADYTPNEDNLYRSMPQGKTKRPAKRSAKRGWYAEEAEAAADLYGGYAGFLVRTAVIRADSFDPLKAPHISDANVVFRLVEHLTYADQEHVVCLAVSNQNKLMAIHEVSIGGTSSTSVELKHLLKVALLCSAPAMIMVHNHPGGDSTPSAHDRTLTQAVKAGADCAGVKLLDHVIVARDGFFSFQSAGMM